MVTDPAVIGSIVSRLERRTDADIAVAGASDERISVARTAEYLGYASLLERFGAEFVDQRTSPEPRTSVPLTGVRSRFRCPSGSPRVP